MDVKSLCPMTTLAASPLVTGALNSRTRLSCVSETHKFPEGSNAIPEGELRAVEFVAVVGPAKLTSPTMTEGVSPIEKGGATIVTTLKALVTQTSPDLSRAIFTGPGIADLLSR
jgi:hypothetical protein